MEASSSEPRRLILCFDGTCKSFQGNTSDTNVVKLLDLFDRSSPQQLHYYQPGIGTYTSDGAVNRSLVGRFKAWASQSFDAGFGMTFDSHVMAGYRFLMRYYRQGDRIYLFGFSRGAFTARFLARLIAQVGLLSKGNEEMVPFIYKVYQDYEMGRPDAGPYMKAFRSTFCRHDCPHGDEGSGSQQANGNYAVNGNGSAGASTLSDAEAGVKVYFLGLWETVNSVQTFDVPFYRTRKPPEVAGTATHVRHAVAIDERRIKFKAALLAMDRSAPGPTETSKEVWFPGDHGDVGGSYLAEEDQPEVRVKPGLIVRLRGHFKPSPLHEKGAHVDKSQDWYQLSDIPLKWMVDELDAVPGEFAWDQHCKADFLARFARNRQEAVRAKRHDILRFHRGGSIPEVLLWRALEYVPFWRRWEYYPGDPGKWKYVRFPLNWGSYRDMPPGALVHHALLERRAAFPNTYRPANEVSVDERAWKLCDVAAMGTGGPTPALAHEPCFVLDHCVGGAETDRVYRLLCGQPGPQEAGFV